MQLHLKQCNSLADASEENVWQVQIIDHLDIWRVCCWEIAYRLFNNCFIPWDACGSGWRPSAPMIWPKKGIRVHLKVNLHLSRLKRRPVSWAIPVTHGKSPKASSTFLWNFSWAQTRSKCRCKNLYLPNGELKVVNSKLSWVSLIFQ